MAGNKKSLAGKTLTDTVLMHHESDVPDFLKELSRRAYPILIPLTYRNLNGQLTGSAANAATLVFFRGQGVAEFDPLREGVTGRQAYFLGCWTKRAPARAPSAGMPRMRRYGLAPRDGMQKRKRY